MGNDPLAPVIMMFIELNMSLLTLSLSESVCDSRDLKEFHKFRKKLEQFITDMPNLQNASPEAITKLVEELSSENDVLMKMVEVIKSNPSNKTWRSWSD
ncbi:MAG: hypothetical protein GY793_06270 [Proteobacteria bacterium]|nr:hypothetical protein [Pseudomonadota bacterium]